MKPATLSFGPSWMFPEEIGEANLGARMIFDKSGRIDVVPDRVDSAGTDAGKKKLLEWASMVGLPALKEVAKSMDWGGSEVFTFSSEGCTIKATPNGSFGYMYMVAFINAEEPT